MRRHFTVTGFVTYEGRTALHWHRLGIWLPPGGHVEPDEDFVQAVHREVLEETGLDVEIVDQPRYAYRSPQPLVPPRAMAVYDIPGDSHVAEPHQHLDAIYFTRPLGGSPTLPDDGMQWRWFNAAEIEAAAELHEDVRELSLAAIEADAAIATRPGR